MFAHFWTPSDKRLTKTHRAKSRLRLTLGAFLGLWSLSLSVIAPVSAQETEDIYAAARAQVYQILIIDKQSKEKAAIGSGFLLNDAGLVATNFHVVSEAVHKPEKYRIEIKSEDGEVGALTLVDFDVIHDLAIARFEEPPAGLPPLVLAEEEPEQGKRIYSLGNPYDLGHTIIPGTYNGLLEQSFYQKLLRVLE